MASTIYVRIENTLHEKVIRCLRNIDAHYGIPHRHSDALKALQDHQILYATYFFTCWLDGAKTMIGIRIPIERQLAHLQFHAYLEQTHLSVVDVSMQPSFYRGLRVEQQQPDEIEIVAAITLRPTLGSGGLPLHEVERLKPMPARLALQKERAEIVRTRTRLGRAYLDYALQKAEEESFSIPYARWERIPRESKVKLTFQKREAVKQQARKIQECQQKEATVAITEGNEDERQRTICAGKIGSFDPATALLTLIVGKNGMPISSEELERARQLPLETEVEVDEDRLKQWAQRLFRTRSGGTVRWEPLDVQSCEKWMSPLQVIVYTTGQKEQEWEIFHPFMVLRREQHQRLQSIVGELGIEAACQNILKSG